MLARRYTLSLAKFQALYAAVLAKMKQDYGQRHDDPNVASSAYFGTGEYAPGKPQELPHSVAYVVLHHPDVQAFCAGLTAEEQAGINFGKYLSGKYYESQKPNCREITFQGSAYIYGYALFLGYPTLGDFPAPLAADTSAEKSLAAPAVHPPATAAWTHYIGTYYSFLSYRVKKFLLAIDYTRETPAGHPAWMWGFHDTEQNRGERPSDLPLRSVRMEGQATVGGTHLYVNLRGDADDRFGRDMQMNLIGLCNSRGGHDLERQEMIMATLQTVSLRYYVVSIETLLLRTTPEYAHRFQHEMAEYNNPHAEPGLSENANRSLHLYLMLQRRNFWTRYPPYSHPEELQVKSNPVRKYIQRLQGTWRVWNLGLQRGKLVQSRLEIGATDTAGASYAAYFYPYIKPNILEEKPDLREQVVALSLSNEIVQEQLCFATYIKHHLNLANYAVFDLGSLATKGFAEGMFVSGGYDAHGVIGGYAVMVKETQGRPVEAKEFRRDEAILEARDLDLTPMYEGLSKLWKRKIWKPRPPGSNAQAGPASDWPA